MSPASERNILRYTHSLSGALILVYLYSPLGANEAFRLLLQWIIVPLVTASGMWMWKGAQIRRSWKQRTSQPSTSERTL